MDITLNKNKLSANQYFNAETVKYTIVYSAFIFIMIAVKQIFNVFFGVGITASSLTGFIIAEIFLFFAERFFVFKGNITASNMRQAIFGVINAAIHFGIYKGCSLLSDKIQVDFYTICFILAVLLFIANYVIARILIFNCEKNADKFSGGRIFRCAFNNRFVLLSMAISLIAMIFIFIVYKVFPFGDTTVLRMDLYHQYGPLFVELYDRVSNHESFIYSWTSGGGSSFLGNYFNYLSSPLNFLIFLFNRDQMPFAISCLVALKCVLSAGTFTFYIKKSQKRHSFASAAFGVLYSFCAYMLAYFWNIMWLDGMIVFPLIILGIENIINNGKSTLYICSLIYLFYSSYYIGYMASIFSVLYFLAYFVISYNGNKVNSSIAYSKKFTFKKLANNKFLNRGFRFALSSLFVGAVCAFFLIPVYFILTGCSATSGSMPTAAKSYFTVLDFIQSHFAGLETTIRSSGSDVLPNVYCGVLTLILVPLFVVNKKISLKEKVAYISLLILLFISFNSNYLNYVWHAFHFPNDLPYRFSFMYSFILLVVSFKALINIRAIGIKEIGFTALGWIAFIAISQELDTNKISEFSIYATIAFIIVWAAVLFIIKNRSLNKFIAGVLIIAVTFCEVIICDTNAFNFNQKLSNYNENYKTYTTAVSHIEENDDSFFRTELCRLNTRMDPCIYGYNGISAFSSMAYENYSKLQYNLGMYGNRINSYTYNTQTPVYNLMYSIKYLIYKGLTSKPSTNLYTKVYDTADYNSTIYENDYFLPISYCVNPNINSWNTEEGNPFEIQGDFFSLATGFSDVFTPAEYASCSYSGVSGDNVSENGTYNFNKSSDAGSIEINLKATQNSNFYLYLSSSDIKNITCKHGIKSDSQVIDTPYILDLGYFNIGEDITVTIDASAMEKDSGSFEIYAYSINENVLRAGYEKLLNNSLDITEHSASKIKGTVTADETSILYSSIPYDEGWSVYIDGEKQSTFEIADSQLGVMIKAGEHTVEYSYRPKGALIGAGISVASVLGLGICIFIKKRKAKKEKYSSSIVILPE